MATAPACGEAAPEEADEGEKVWRGVDVVYPQSEDGVHRVGVVVRVKLQLLFRVMV